MRSLPVRELALAERLDGLTPEQLAYKGMVGKKAALLAHLRGLGA